MWQLDPSEARQSLPTSSSNGCVLRARRWPWRLHRTWAGLDCMALDVAPLARDAPSLSTLLTPFDRVQRLPVCQRWRHGSRAALHRAVARLAGRWPDQPLAALTSLRVAPWPHQLAPSLAIVEGRGARVLVADEVGLGKTLTATLLLAELTSRGIGRRVLVLVPAGLRDQWHDELRDRAGLAADVIDAPALALRARARPPGESAWAAPGIVIASLDFARQPTVLAGLVEWPWDLLVVDEAHQVSSDTARAAAVSRVAKASRMVLLLTATPHTGDRAAYRRLLEIGGGDEPVLWFRRERAVVAPVAPRRTRRWAIAPTRAESRVLDALSAYARRVDRAAGPEARLAMVVLRKRALSSAEALRLSLEHRRRALGGDLGEQLVLPLEGPPGEIDAADAEQPAELTVPGLEDRSSELDTLDALIEQAGDAASDWSKWRVIDRLLRRTAEPVVLFTEYRDTLRELESRYATEVPLAVLHGGLDREQRRESVTRFTRGDVRLLVATDAAAEGLNLQARCRLVVNVELPWSPRVLEQRAGRVDRIGQTRVVHAWHLVGRSGHEAMVAAALARRLDAIRADLGAPADDGTGPPPIETDRKAPYIAPHIVPPEIACAWWRLRARLAEACRPAGNRSVRQGCLWVRARRPAGIGCGVVVIFSRDAGAAPDAEQHVALHVALSRLPPGSPSRWLPALVEAARPVAARALASPTGLAMRLIAREDALLRFAAQQHAASARRWQPSFFDRRAAHVVEAARRDLTRVASAHDARRRALAGDADTGHPEPVFALLLR